MTAITVDQVRGFISTGASDASIQLVINLVDEADTCLTTLASTEAQNTLVKIYGACALLLVSSGGGIQSQSSFTGDSVTFAGKEKGEPNQYLNMLQGMAGGTCVLTAIGYGIAYPIEIQRT